jgi:hypothetical protein
MQENPNTATAAEQAAREALLRAAAICEQHGTPDALECAEAIRAEAGVPVRANLDFVLGQQLLDWNRQQATPPIRVGCEYAVALEAFRLMAKLPLGIAADAPVLVVTGARTYRVLPRELPEAMLLALGLVTGWDEDEEGNSTERDAIYEGWEALMALAPEVVLPDVHAAQSVSAPSLRPGSAFLVNLDSLLRQAEAFNAGQVSAHAVRGLVLGHQGPDEKEAANIDAWHRLHDLAQLWQDVQALAGYWQDGSARVVVFDQDETQRQRILRVGDKTYHADTYAGCVRQAMDDQLATG